MWKLNGTEAYLEQGKWRAHYCTAHPELGVLVSHSDSKASIAMIGLIQPSAGRSRPANESYVRQNDLIADFAQCDQSQFGFETYFRMIPSASHDLLGMEIWLSVQTELLDSTPAMDLTAIVPNAQWVSVPELMIGGVPAGWRSLPQGDSSATLGLAALVLVHPLDVAQTSHVVNPLAARDMLPLRIFSHFMEKGVIRRARVQVYLSHQTFSAGLCRELFEHFAASELPLTT